MFLGWMVVVTVSIAILFMIEIVNVIVFFEASESYNGNLFIVMMMVRNNGMSQQTEVGNPYKNKGR